MTNIILAPRRGIYRNCLLADLQVEARNEMLKEHWPKSPGSSNYKKTKGLTCLKCYAFIELGQDLCSKCKKKEINKKLFHSRLGYGVTKSQRKKLKKTLKRVSQR